MKNALDDQRLSEQDLDDEARLLERVHAERQTLAMGVGTIVSAATHAALDRLILRGWLRLVDIIPEGNGSGRLVRIFLMSQDARNWIRGRARRSKMD